MVDQDFTFEDFLRERHAELPLYLVTLSLNPTHPGEVYGTQEGREMLRQHFLYWCGLEEQSLLVGAGPVSPGSADQSGLAIIRATSLDHAEALAQKEPLHVAGWRTNSVRPWQLNEGLAVSLVKSLPEMAPS